MPGRMPAGFTPPYPAWAGRFFDPDGTCIVARFGVQSPRPGGGNALLSAIRGSFDMATGPQHVDRACFNDGAGWYNDLFIAYWDDPSAFGNWSAESGVRDWHRDTASGLWIEIMAMPVQRIETLYTTDNRSAGLSHLTPALAETPVHAYWGAMRDRIPAARSETLDSVMGGHLPKPVIHQTHGRRLRVRVPGNLCFIRTAQDWSACGALERATYLETVAPVLDRGTRDLRERATETGCCSAHLLQETTLDGKPLDKTCVTAFLLSLAHLEHWAEHHPAHLSIFGSFMQMAQKHDAKPDLRLWHEVAVLPPGGLHAEYVDCHPQTGLLPWFEVEQA